MRFATSAPVALIALAAAGAAAPTESMEYAIRNNCPAPLAVYINGRSQGILRRDTSLNRRLDASWSGFIYSSSNGGNANGVGTTRAAFYGETDYYYIVKQEGGFNMGVSISPKAARNGTLCERITCDSDSCQDAFTAPPTDFRAARVDAPLHSCPYNHRGYTVTFCPSGRFPGPAPTSSSVIPSPTPPVANTVRIHPLASQGKCLDVRGAVFQNGTPVQVYDCNGTNAQRWVVKRGAVDRIQVAGTNFCLDAGSNPANGVGMKIWTCYKNLPAQEWKFTNDGRVLLANSVFALDLTEGSLKNANQVQTWTFYPDNNNQKWSTSAVYA
ncbi:ricin B-like lectin [Agrocybe pediades]|nr:ricin B-like lectin [Agrocybe pediades]